MALTAKQSKWLIFSAIAAAAYGVFSLRRAGGLGGSTRFIGKRAREAPILESHSEGGMLTTHRRDADLSIESRVATLQSLVYKGIQSGPMRKLSLQVVSGCEARDKYCEAQKIFQYVQQNVRYSGDIGNVKFPDGTVDAVDVFQSAARTLEFGAGDCDDHSVAILTMMASVGLDGYFKVTSETNDDSWSHVYAVVDVPSRNGKQRLVAADSTLPNGSFGDEAPAARALLFPA